MHELAKARSGILIRILPGYFIAEHATRGSLITRYHWIATLWIIDPDNEFFGGPG